MNGSIELFDEELFSTELDSDKVSRWGLWDPEGTKMSSIVIVKEVWINLNGEHDDKGDGMRYPVFHVFNYIDPSRACSPESGCRVNPAKSPWYSYQEAAAVAEEMYEDALASDEWVTIDELAEVQ